MGYCIKPYYKYDTPESINMEARMSIYSTVVLPAQVKAKLVDARPQCYMWRAPAQAAELRGSLSPESGVRSDNDQSFISFQDYSNNPALFCRATFRDKLKQQDAVLVPANDPGLKAGTSVSYTFCLDIEREKSFRCQTEPSVTTWGIRPRYRSISSQSRRETCSKSGPSPSVSWKLTHRYAFR